MKNLCIILCMAVMVFQCSTDNSFDKKPAYDVTMKFQVNGTDQMVAVHFEYSQSQKRYIHTNKDVEEIKAVNSATQEVMYVYTLKSEYKKSINSKFEIKVGYYGYSSQTGCYYFGTLYVGDNGQSLFVPASGVNAVANPPLCGYYYA